MDPTESRDPETVGIDILPTDELVDTLIGRHLGLPAVVAEHAADLARAVDAAAGRLRGAGRLAYAGSGTSGLLAEADALELPATFGWPAERILVLRPAPGGEDSAEGGRQAAERAGLGPADVVVALSASGRTPFTLGAVRAAGGALVVAIVCNPGSPIAAAADHALKLEVGPEPIAGSTRMRAGLTQRLALTVLSTALMVRLGRTHDNLMVEVSPGLRKLRARQEWIVAEACGVTPDEAKSLLAAAGGEVKTAIAMSLGHTTAERARQAIGEAGTVRGALDALAPRAPAP